jgi:hypothetical protein
MKEYTEGLSPAHRESLEYKPGCPVCEHSDPELDRELRAFAELMVDVVMEWRQKRNNDNTGTRVDKAI